tara:strand:+ start:287 stop:850 length:564 start_codon:yes stop_codon:yes gene_type:complete
MKLDKWGLAQDVLASGAGLLLKDACELIIDVVKEKGNATNLKLHPGTVFSHLGDTKVKDLTFEELRENFFKKDTCVLKISKIIPFFKIKKELIEVFHDVRTNTNLQQYYYDEEIHKIAYIICVLLVAVKKLPDIDPPHPCQNLQSFKTSINNHEGLKGVEFDESFVANVFNLSDDHLWLPENIEISL